MPVPYFQKSHLRSFRLLAFLMCLLISGKGTFAGILLDSVGQHTWDQTTSPLGFDITFGISPNNLPPTDNLLNTFSIGIVIVPDAAQNGTVRIRSVSIPTNPVFSTYSDLRFSGAAAQVVTGDNQAISAGNSLPRDFALQSQKNIFTAQLYSPSNDAKGSFKIYAVPSLTTYFTENSFDGEKFFNVPDSGPQVLLGSFNVSAVPEPTSLLLLGVTSGGLAVIRMRRKRQLAKTLRNP